MNTSEIIRALQLDDKVVHVHIHLSEDEIRRLLLPLVAQAFADELHRRSPIPNTISSGTSRAWLGGINDQK